MNPRFHGGSLGVPWWIPGSLVNPRFPGGSPVPWWRIGLWLPGPGGEIRNLPTGTGVIFSHTLPIFVFVSLRDPCFALHLHSTLNSKYTGHDVHATSLYACSGSVGSCSLGLIIII